MDSGANKKGMTKTKIAIIAFLTVIVGTAYLAADRYLIRHVEITDVNQYEVSKASKNSLDSSNDNLAGGEAEQSTLYRNRQGGNRLAPPRNDKRGTAQGTAQDTAGETEYTADDWNYKSNTASISIQQITTGSDNDKVTYYVADVTVADAADLSSAFADNQFGRNIIEDTSDIAEANKAVFAVNGDYYGFRSDGIEIRNGVVYRNEPVRTGLAIYKDGSMKVYDETQTDAEKLVSEGVLNTMSFGPAMLVNSEIPSNIDSAEVDTNFGNHSIQGNQPRTGIGIIDRNHFVFVVVDGRSKGYSRGVTLTEFAGIFKGQGCTDAYNLDGGGSSTMYFKGRVVNNPQGRNRERGVSDIFYIG